MLSDLRYALRSLARAGGFTLTVVVTLAIGIGATTAIVSIARRIIFPSIPYPEPDRIVIVTDPAPAGSGQSSPFPFFSFPYRLNVLRESAASFAALGAQRHDFLNLVVGTDPGAANVAWVTAGYFSILGVTPEQGRLFLPDEYQIGGGDVAVVAWKFWRERLGGDPDVVGKDILLGGKSRRVLGVLPRGFTPPPRFTPAEVYLPETISPAPQFSTKWEMVFCRLKPGVSLERARAELATIRFPAVAPLDANGLARLRPWLTPLPAYYATPTTRLFWVFLGAAGFLYAIACSNAVNLMLARMVARRQEVGIRLAMGSSQGRLARWLFAENLILASASGAAGILVAWMGALAMAPLLPSAPPFWGDKPRIDSTMLAIAAGLSVVTCLLVGIVPAWRIRRSHLGEILKEGAGTLADGRRLRRLRAGLAAIQTAMAALLLIGTGLMLRSYVRLAHVDFGFNLANKLAVAGLLPEGVPPNDYLQLATRLRDELARLPGVRHATFSQGVPLSVFRSSWTGIKFDGRPDLGEATFSYNKVSPEYFATLGLPLVAGQGFDRLKPGDPPVAVINQTAARRFFGGSEAIGHRLDMGRHGKWEIIGVVGDVRENGQRGKPDPQFYMPFWQPPTNPVGLTILLDMASRPRAGFEAMVRKAAYAVEPRLVIQLNGLADVARGAIQTERYTLLVLQTLASLALTLAALGLFAVIAYSVAQRQREFGVRAALGAAPGQLLRLVLGEGVRVVALGLAIGFAAAWGLTRFLQSVLFDTSATDATTFAAVAAILLVAAVAACWLPARRAARVDVARLLRAE